MAAGENLVGDMSYEEPVAGAPENDNCRYDGSRLTYRGPHRPIRGSYTAIIGGSETHGRHVSRPFASLLERAMVSRCVNLGVVNSGPEAFLRDEGSLDIARKAGRVVLQVMDGAVPSNRFFKVHPRRNDRFVAPTPELIALFPEVDFADIHFVRHLLAMLKAACPNRYRAVESELQLHVERLFHPQSAVIIEYSDAFCGRDKARALCPSHIADEINDGLLCRSIVPGC